MGTFILDTNICVDLYNGNLLEAVLKLPYAMVLPDVVIFELEEPEGSILLSMGYRSHQLSPGEVEIVSQYSTKYLKPSRTDLFALVAAKTSKTTLLTGDDHLRKAAIAEHVDVHGLLWLLDLLFENEIAPGPQLVLALNSILAEGARLPQHEIQKRRDLWK